jgi:eukaryotic-like serine/threonine-protein kinase
MVGETLDRYTIESKLGEGGMGVVYKARDTHLDRIVAIKVLPHDKVADPDRRQRFVQEARAASALNHPGIVAVYDIRSDGGIDFIVMEYVAGRTLDQVIPAKGLGVTQALRYGVQVADALATAHGAGIIHRDLKPANVMVTDEGRVKILDFGLAKLLDPADGAAEAGTRSVLTKAGIVVGTAAYMSPEQAEGRKVDSRSDIFSFGSVLYEMVTGRRPFAGESPLSVLAKILNDDPAPPSKVVASVPPDVERAILRCLRKDPARRYQTMADLKVALEDLAEDSAAGRLAQTSAPRAARSWRWAWAAAIPVLLAVAYVAWRAAPSPGGATLKAVPLTSLPGVVRHPSFSPDGNHVAFTWTGPKQDNPDVYVQQIGAGSPLRLTTDAGNDSSPVWSPDGRSIAFLRQQPERLIELRLIPPLGGPDRKLTEIRPHGAFLRPVTLGWCPDSSCVVVTDAPDETKRDALFVVSVETGERRQLTYPPQSALADTDPAVSPDGRWLVFRRDTAPFNGQLQLLALGSDVSARSEPRPITPTLLVAYSPAWMPDSTEIIFSAKSALWRLAIGDGSTASRLPFVGDDGLRPVVARPQPGGPARLIYVRSFADINIWRVETTAPGAAAISPPVVAVSSTRHDAIPVFSPDGQRVVFMSDRSGESEVLGGRFRGQQPGQAHLHGRHSGLRPLVSRREDDRVPLQS